MKLRDKKTGEISEFNEIYLTKTVKETNTATSEYVERAFYSISDLQDEFEDYKPAEPLIKDEKIRKAVRVWLESWEDTPDNWQYWEQDYEEFHIARGDVEIFFPVSNGAKAGWYTIAELCGEEEE